MNKVLSALKLLTVTVLLLSFSSSIIFARAGGGESFGDGGFDSGGSFDFGGSSGSFGGDVGSSTDSFTSNSSGGWFGCIILILIIVFILILSRKGGGGNGRSISSSTTDIPTTNRSDSQEELNSKLTELKKIDKGFDKQKFKTHVKKVFMSVQEGWTKRDQSVCRPFMAEEVYQSHQMQIDAMKRNKTVNVLENIVVGSIDFTRLDIDDEYHKITMKVRASMKDYKVKEDEPEKVIEGDKKQSPPFTEYWVFIRRSNLKTKIKDGIFDRKCPNCGAPIKVDVAGICKYCDANVVNGDYDWVLSEIVQKSEWRE